MNNLTYADRVFLINLLKDKIVFTELSLNTERDLTVRERRLANIERMRDIVSKLQTNA